MNDEQLTQQTLAMVQAYFNKSLRSDVCTGCDKPIVDGEQRTTDIFVRPDSWSAQRFPQELIERLIAMANDCGAPPDNVEFRHYHYQCWLDGRKLEPKELEMTSQLNPDQTTFGRSWRFI